MMSYNNLMHWVTKPLTQSSSSTRFLLLQLIAQTCIKKKWWQYGIAKQAVLWALQRCTGRGWPKIPAEEIWGKNVEGRIQEELEKDGGSSTRQNWTETSGLWLMLHWKQQGVTQVTTNDNDISTWGWCFSASSSTVRAAVKSSSAAFAATLALQIQ